MRESIDSSGLMSTTQQPPKIPCPHCQALIKTPALPAGSLVNCPKCGQAFRLGEQEGIGGRGSGVGSQGSGVGGGQVQGRGTPEAGRSKVQSPAVAKPPAAGSVSQPASSKPPSAPVKRPVAAP